MVKNLRSLREEYGLSRKQLAESLNLTEKKIYSYEREQNGSEPSLDVLVKMADFFGVTVDEIIGRSTVYSAQQPVASLDLALFGKRIKERREQLGLSSKALAESAGITAAYLTVLEKGKKTPKIDTCIRILNALCMSADSAFMDSLVAAQYEKANYLQYKLAELAPEQRLPALRAFALILKAFRND